MKFAKKLSEDMRQDWNAHYIDYKMMKKLLKWSDADTCMRAFCDMYEAQLMKVQEFMCGQQEMIVAGISPLELDLQGQDVTLSKLQSLSAERGDVSGHCQQLVSDIECFRDFASLNIMGMRKIIKKFDKRFQMKFKDIFGHQSAAASKIMRDGDIERQLLFPAQQCLKLMRLAVDPASAGVDRPLRQYNFWVAELRAGSEIARRHVSGKSAIDATRLRLVMRDGNDDLGLCIKNTFIDEAELEVESPTSRRSSSVPCRMRLLVVREDRTAEGTIVIEDDCDALACTPLVSVEHFICESLQIAPPPRILYPELDRDFSCNDNDIQFLRSPSMSPSPMVRDHFTDRQLPPGILNSTPTSFVGFSSSTSPIVPGSFGNTAPKAQRSRAKPQTPGAVLGSARQPPCSFNSVEEMNTTTYRWWAQANASMTCPLSGFPISMLPYPPFKFHMRSGSEHRKESPMLVDGPFLVLQVLTTWNFDVLGRPLLVADVASLDSYMKRCKLGPFRLGRAMELLAAGTNESHRELSDLQAQAKRKLDNLRHVQNFRRIRNDQGQQGTATTRPSERRQRAKAKAQKPAAPTGAAPQSSKEQNSHDV